MKTLKGFTLIELIVVIIVFAFIMTLLLPAFTTAVSRETSFLAQCANHLKNFAMANTIYANEHQGWFVPVIAMEPNSKGTININGVIYESRTWLGYKAFRDILNYDSYPKNKRNAPLPGQAGWNAYNTPYNMPAELLCPADRICIDWKNQSDGILLDLAYNMTDWQGPPQEWDLTFQRYYYMGHNISKITSPSEKLCFIDGIDWFTLWTGRSADYYNWDKLHQASSIDYRTIHGYPRDSNNVNVYAYGPVFYRHNEGANIAFYDGRVQYMRKQQIFVYDDIYMPGTRNMLPPDQRRPGMWVADMETYLRNQMSQ